MLTQLLINKGDAKGAVKALRGVLRAKGIRAMTVQNRINTGLKVSSAKDNGAIWAIAQNQRSSILSLDQVKDSLNRAQSTVDVAVSAAGRSLIYSTK